MDLMDEELRSHLDPSGIRILTKRLVSGKITPQVFKDILRRQMVKYYFRTHPHPLAKSWEGWRGSLKKRLGFGENATRGAGDFEKKQHKRF